MAYLVLSDSEQAVVRALIASKSARGVDLLGEDVLEHLARLVPCDALGIALVDDAADAGGEPIAGRPRAGEDDPTWDEPPTVGVQQRPRPRDRGPGTRAAAVLSLGVRGATDHVVTLWLVRRTRDFTARDRRLFELVAPALERILRERPASKLPPLLTAQERRVLHLVGTGLSNAEIAERLFVAPCTVRKHLENAYRKLRVSNRLAAVHALEVGWLDASDPVPPPRPRPAEPATV